MKKTKLFSAILLMILSVALLAAGIYSASEADKKMGVGGMISIPANLIDVVVYGYIGPVRTVDDYDFSSLNSNEWIFSDEQKSQMTFITAGKDKESEVDPIVLNFLIINNSEMKLKAYFSDSSGGEAISNAFLDGTNFENASIGVEFVSADNIAENNDSDTDQATISISFTLKRFLDESKPFDFSYFLIVSDEVEE